MRKIDMSPEAITARLKRTSQLRRLGLSLRKTKFSQQENKPENQMRPDLPSKSPTRKAK